MSPLAQYDALTVSGGPVRADKHQRHIVEQLDQLWNELQHYHPPEIKGTAQSGAAAPNKNQDENLFRSVRKTLLFDPKDGLKKAEKKERFITKIGKTDFIFSHPPYFSFQNGLIKANLLLLTWQPRYSIMYLNHCMCMEQWVLVKPW